MEPVVPDRYRERPSRLPGAVAWTRGAHPSQQARVLPDGCMDLMWVDGVLVVAGPDTTAFLTGEPANYAGVRFAPGDGPAVLGVPAAELRNRRIPLADLWPAALTRRLTDRVNAAEDLCAELEQVSLERMRPTDPAVAAVASLLSAGATVAETASALEMGERRLHRRCLDAFGYGPKTLARILRMNRAVGLARAGTPFATVAAQAGYADQAHLARDVKAFAGVPLGSLV